MVFGNSYCLGKYGTILVFSKLFVPKLWDRYNAHQFIRTQFVCIFCLTNYLHFGDQEVRLLPLMIILLLWLHFVSSNSRLLIVQVDLVVLPVPCTNPGLSESFKFVHNHQKTYDLWLVARPKCNFSFLRILNEVYAFLNHQNFIFINHFFETMKTWCL